MALPELPDARIEIRSAMRHSPVQKRDAKMMAKRAAPVNANSVLSVPLRLIHSSAKMARMLAVRSTFCGNSRTGGKSG